MNAERWQKIKEIFNRAADLSVAERPDFLARSGVDTESRREIERMLAFADDAEEDDLLERNAFESFLDAEDQKLPAQIGKYRIVREIGRGGMGAVYEAVYETADFRQKVAVKVIKRGMDTEALVRRFRHEQKILASLEHPNIARFLDGGVTSDGLPFYAMEYVEGDFIDDYCREKNLSIRERLLLFRQVCSAIQYAHQNLVIHRDLKSKNILVTADGEPKLLDFGIAKVLVPEATEEIGTATGLGMMTPAYASPEQIQGKRIGTTSDIYSLGVILYELLTGRRPYRISSHSQVEIERAVLENEPLKPSSAAGYKFGRTKLKSENSESSGEASLSESQIPNPKSLRGDLDNIILKALRKEPERRYVSVGQFSEDVRRYLEGLPVIARPHTFSYRAAKFIRRNRAGVVAAAVVFLSLCAGITVAIWQAHRAERQRILAENRFAEVRELANSVIFKYHDAIADLPGATGTREMLVRDATRYLDNLARESTDNPELQRELARAYLKLGDVQGKQYGSNIGDTASAQESYRKAARLLESIVENAGGKADLETVSELINAYEALFGIYMRTGDADKFEVLDKALAMSEKLLAAAPEDQKYKLQNIRLLILLGDSKTVPEKLAPFQKALSLGENLYSAHPSDEEIIRLLMRLNQRVGSTYIWLGDEAKRQADAPRAAANYASALPFHEKSAAFAERLLRLEPSNTSFKRNLAISSNNLAETLAKNRRRAETLLIMNRGLEIFEQMAAADPRNKELKMDIGFAHGTIAEMWLELGETNRAIVELEKAIEAHAEIRKRDSENMEAVKALFEHHETLAGIYRAQGDRAKTEFHEKKKNEYIARKNQ